MLECVYSGVAGYLFLWQCNLDQITMLTLIMSIGFSIDFSAHVVYGSYMILKYTKLISLHVERTHCYLMFGLINDAVFGLGYVNADKALSPEQRCIHSMQQLAWPVFQVCTSLFLRFFSADASILCPLFIRN